jgi:hypothetical protein
MIYVVVCIESYLHDKYFHLVKAFKDKTKAEEYCGSLPRRSNELTSIDFEVLRVRLEE